MAFMNKVALIIPVYNSADILPRTLQQLQDFFKDRAYLAEIIFVDDGSGDESKEMIREFAQNSGLKVRLLAQEKNAGKGQAVKAGVGSVANDIDYIFFSDDDLPFGLGPFDEMYQQLAADASLDFITGDRTLVAQNNPYPLHRRIGSYAYGLLMPPAVRIKFPDVHAGIRAYKTAVAKKIFSLTKNSRWSFDPEIFAIAINNDFKVVKVSVRFLAHVKGTRFRIKDYLNVAWELVKLRVNNRLGRYRLKK